MPEQLELDFEAVEREAERLAATPAKKDRRNRILQAAINDGFDNSGQRVMAWTCKLVLLAINSFDWRQRSTKVIGERCGNPEWAKLIPNGRKLSPRTVKSAIQALENMDLLDRIDRGRRTECRVILWQNLRPAPMGATATGMGATVPPMGAMAPKMGATVAPPIHEGNQETNHEGSTDDDDEGISFLREKGNQFLVFFSAAHCRDRAIRKRVLRICELWRVGRIPEHVCQDVLEDLRAKFSRVDRFDPDGNRPTNPRGLLHKLFKNRGYDLDALHVDVPDELVAPPDGVATISTTKGR
jgi:hypothetical protein